MTSEEDELVEKGLRLPTGAMHQCKCSLHGRSHIINGTVNPNVLDWDAVEDLWGVNYTAAAKATADENYASAISVMSPAEAAAYSDVNYFGIHSVGCPFHRSGPCRLEDVENGFFA
jgi:hypothetical protein